MEALFQTLDSLKFVAQNMITPISDERIVIVYQNDEINLAYILSDDRVHANEAIFKFGEYKSDTQHEINMMNHNGLGQLSLETMYTEKNVKEKPDKFRASILQYSSPSIDINKLRNAPDIDFQDILVFCLNQWEMLYNAGGSEGERCRCCCSQNIEKLNFYKNAHNGNVLMIGSDCVKKFGKSSSTRMYDDHKLYSKIFKKCIQCKKKVPANEFIGNCCISDYCQQSNTSSKRPCISCLDLKNREKCKKCTLANNPNIIIVRVDITNSSFGEQVHGLLLKYRKTCTKCKQRFYSTTRVNCTQCFEEMRSIELKNEKELERKRQDEIYEKRRREVIEKSQGKLETVQNIKSNREIELKRNLEKEDARRLSGGRKCPRCEVSIEDRGPDDILCLKCHIERTEKKCSDCKSPTGRDSLIKDRCNDCNIKWTNRKCLDCDQSKDKFYADGDLCIDCHRKNMHSPCACCKISTHKNKLSNGICMGCITIRSKQL